MLCPIRFLYPIEDPKIQKSFIWIIRKCFVSEATLIWITSKSIRRDSDNFSKPGLVKRIMRTTGFLKVPDLRAIQIGMIFTKWDFRSIRWKTLTSVKFWAGFGFRIWEIRRTDLFPIKSALKYEKFYSRPIYTGNEISEKSSSLL